MLQLIVLVISQKDFLFCLIHFLAFDLWLNKMRFFFGFILVKTNVEK